MIFTVNRYSKHYIHLNTLKKHIMQRITLILFKLYIRELAKPLLLMFIGNSDIHNYNTRGDLLKTTIGSSEAAYVHFSFHVVYIGTLFLRKCILMSLTAALTLGT